jgi:hypothetical protein
MLVIQANTIAKQKPRLNLSIYLHMLACAGTPGADSGVVSLAVGGRIPIEDPRIPLHSWRAGVRARPRLWPRLFRRGWEAQSAVLA